MDKYFKSESCFKGVLIAIFAVSIVFQTFLFVKNPSFWHDEAALALNITSRSFAGLLDGLDNLQVAPPGFLFLSKLMLVLFNPKTDYWRDFCLRVIPFLSGILSIAAFYYLSTQVFRNRLQILISNLLFALNPCAILYASQYKQYSTELFVSVILLSILYNIINGSFKKYYYLILVLAPFFSYSSIFILITGCILSFRKRVCIPVIAGLVFLYIINLRCVFNINYSGMNDFYSDFYSFVSFLTPVRLLIRFSELFISYKIKVLNLLCGAFGALLVLTYVFAKRIQLREKLLFLGPIIAVILASSLHKYPVQARLILFLLPNFVIIAVSCSSKIIRAMCVIILLYSLTSYTIYADWLSYSYARDIVKTIKSSIKPEDKIVIDRGGYEYRYYLQNSGIKNKVLTVPEFCYSDTQVCKDFINNLPAGGYYFLTTGYGADRLSGAEGLNVGYEPEQIKAVFINK